MKKKHSVPPEVSSCVCVICKNEEADGPLWLADLEEDSVTFNNRLELYQEAVPLENPVGFLDCQRHRSSPVWIQVQKKTKQNRNIRTLWGKHFTKKNL